MTNMGIQLTQANNMFPLPRQVLWTCHPFASEGEVDASAINGVALPSPSLAKGWQIAWRFDGVVENFENMTTSN